MTAALEYLTCGDCGAPLIPEHGRGRHDDDGNLIWHRDGCRCRWCGPIWIDDCDAEPVRCECGARCVVFVDDGHAHARVLP